MNDFGVVILSENEQIFVPRDKHVSASSGGESRKLVVNRNDLCRKEQLGSTKKIGKPIGVIRNDDISEDAPSREVKEFVNGSRRREENQAFVLGGVCELVATGVPPAVNRISASRPRLPTRIALFTLPM